MNLKKIMLSLLYLTLVAAVAIASYLSAQKVSFSSLEAHPEYPSSYKPIAVLDYSKTGLSDELDASKSDFKSYFATFATTAGIGTQRPEALESYSLVALGDIMAHAAVQLGAYKHRLDPNEKSGGYDWVLEASKKITIQSDLSFGNLETPIADTQAKSGFPRFNASSLYLDAMANNGLDLLFLANNHALDLGNEGLSETVKALTSRSITAYGATPNPEDWSPYIIHTITKPDTGNSLKVGFINYTTHTNKGSKFPEQLNFLKDEQPEEFESHIENLIKTTRNAGAEMVVVFLHWGKAYHQLPRKRHVTMARRWAEAGADLILGSGPHVIQPIEIIYTHNNKVTDEVNNTRKHVVAYSLGNLISHQRGMSRFGLALETHWAKNNESLELVGLTPHIFDSKLEEVEIEDSGRVKSVSTFRLQPSSPTEFLDYIQY